MTEFFVEHRGLMVGNHGTILGPKGPRKLGKRRDGYLAVNTAKYGNLLVHRLVAEAWLSKDKDCNVVAHLDHDKTNNHVDNLMWCSQKDNIHQSIRDKRRNYTKPLGFGAGGKNSMATSVTYKDTTFESLSSLCEHLGVKRSAVQKMIDFGEVVYAGKGPVRHKRQKQFSIFGQVFGTLHEAFLKTGIPTSTIYKRLREKVAGYSYIKES